MALSKKRLDVLIVERGLMKSRQRAQATIMAGKVFIDEKRVDKPGTPVDVQANIRVQSDAIPYVSRGGLKLEKALESFKIQIKEATCIDIGASTGGFTDCLLQHGAATVYAVDVGYGQLDWKLRNDARVHAIERTNVRHMPSDALPCRVDLATIDVSFISLKIVVPAVLKFLKKHGDIIALIKPQFEVGKGQVGKGGVVRDPEQHDAVIKNLKQFFISHHLDCSQLVTSPITGPKGNREFLIHLKN